MQKGPGRLRRAAGGFFRFLPLDNRALCVYTVYIEYVQFG